MKKKSLTISHTQHRTFKPKKKNWDVREKGDSHRVQEKVNKGNKNRKKLKEKKLVKFN